ncbi:hypothetical protein [Shewanella sp. KJ2020]|nr:hypothetical protein [Shewanella sp. KJ2020]
MRLNTLASAGIKTDLLTEVAGKLLINSGKIMATAVKPALTT